MFKIFLSLLFGGFVIISTILVFKRCKEMWKNYKVIYKTKVKTEKKDKQTSLLDEIEQKLYDEYKKICLSLLINQAKTAKTEKLISLQIQTQRELAKKYKDSFIKTGKIEFKESGMAIIETIVELESLLDMSRKVNKDCSEKLEVADMNYNLALNKLSNKRIERNILNSIEGGRREINIDLKQVLEDYTNKLNAMRIDITVNDEVNRKYEKQISTFNIDGAPKEILEMYEKL